MKLGLKMWNGAESHFVFLIVHICVRTRVRRALLQSYMPRRKKLNPGEEGEIGNEVFGLSLKLKFSKTILFFREPFLFIFYLPRSLYEVVVYFNPLSKFIG